MNMTKLCEDCINIKDENNFSEFKDKVFDSFENKIENQIKQVDETVIDLKKEKEVIRKFKSLKEENRTKELCEEVLGYDGNMLIYVPLKHKNPEMCLRAFEYGDFEEVFKGIPKEFLTEDFIIELIHINRRVTKLLPKELKTDKVMEVAGYRKKK